MIVSPSFKVEVEFQTEFQFKSLVCILTSFQITDIIADYSAFNLEVRWFMVKMTF